MLNLKPGETQNLKVDIHINVLPPELATAEIGEITKNESKWFQKAMNHPQAKLFNAKSTFQNAAQLIDENIISHGICFPYQFADEGKCRSANNHLIEQLENGPMKLAGLITLQPDSEISREEALLLVAHPKVLGVKMKPQWGNFTLNDFETLGFLYEELSKRGKFLLTHVTQNFHPSRGDGVAELFSLLANFPKLKVVGAHMAGFISVYCDYSPVRKHLENLFVDISLPSNLRWLPHMMNLHDEEKFLYATDYPYIEHKAFDELLELAGVTSQQYEKLVTANPKKFLNDVWQDLL